MSTNTIDVGVIGVGSMGRHHARVYQELPTTELVGVADADLEAATSVASDYETTALSIEKLLDRVDAVSIAVPTKYHFETAMTAFRRETHVLVEKPIVDSPEYGQELIEFAGEHDLVLQVGHIERFNPAIQALVDIVPDLDVLAVDARRLGPPLDRDIGTSPVLDLMIHDIDVLLSLLDEHGDVTHASATADDQHVTATVEFGDVLGTLTASRITQQKVREMTITARECQVYVDYISRSIQIHRHSLPEYIEENGDLRYRHENIVEHPTVENGEPLKKELAAFAEAIRTGTEPVVTGEDGLEALRVASEIETVALGGERVIQ
ncbi:Gfo/Idh/MocA family protein [Natranaeroarchaeum sulfidigenes]|uniref:Putative dehydrogenase n=1 Tax=Natranaeroarchaeum sulfidigenes TaxID=2784880 RepID=A0A897MSJ6_9EURY|nr:Gfo/Idh/MocA family oxidoreductase [Natranaeroarchaeum sulfidigenes]QSG03008.1 putative dehydrogenase [Natranaeroarchaeum sulfidigenes]